MKFILKNSKKLSPELFESHPVWAEYHEPQDIDRIVQDGFTKKEVISTLEKVNYSDDYIFPVRHYSLPSPYEFTLYKTTITLPNNVELPAFSFVIKNEIVSINIFYKNKIYILKQSMPEITEDEEKDFCARICASSIYPMKIKINQGFSLDTLINPYTNKKKIYIA